MSTIKSFKINVPDEQLARLKQKLELTDFPDEIGGEEPWARGPPLADIRRLVEHWRTDYEWRKAEARLNEIPQFTTAVEVPEFGEYTMHFIHQRRSCKQAMPLLLLHGWPGSFLEFSRILPYLAEGGKDFPAFDVVVPSLVNFGFSDGQRKSGWALRQHAHACHALMQRLGYTRYVMQGGDLGSFTARSMVQTFPDSIGGLLLNNAEVREPTLQDDPKLYAKTQATPLTDDEKRHLEQAQQFKEKGRAYFMLQATKPQKIGYSVADSPVGLLAWIYDKLHDWSDNYPWTDDEVLTWVMIYWFSKAGPAASQRIYYDIFKAGMDGHWTKYSKVPLGLSRGAYDMSLYPTLWYETAGPVVFAKQHARGGHFAAYERPKELAEDLREMFGLGGGAAECIEGRSGYD